MSGTQDHSHTPTSADEDAQDDFVDQDAVSRAERRLHLMAFDYWHGLKDGRTYPLFKSLTPAGLAPFREHCLLLELSGDDPLVRFAGPGVADLLEGPVEKGMSLKAFAGSAFAEALVKQYSTEEGRTQAVEFEFEEETLRCRGVILPFSSTGDRPHFSMVVANSRRGRDTEELSVETEVPTSGPSEGQETAPDQSIQDGSNTSGEEVDDYEPIGDESDGQEPAVEETEIAEGPAYTHEGTVQPEPGHEHQTPVTETPQSAAQSLSTGGAEAVDNDLFGAAIGVCRQAAGDVAHLDGGSREKLYHALAAALALHEQAAANPAAFADMLKRVGLKMQVRAPFTPALKLTFGKNYDKTRLTEYAAALSYASRQGQSSDTLAAFLEKEPGGIKGCVRRERAARRGEIGTSASLLQERAADIVRSLPSVAAGVLEGQEEFCLVIARRVEDGSGYELIGPAEVGQNTVDAAIRRLADKSNNKP